MSVQCSTKQTRKKKPRVGVASVTTSQLWRMAQLAWRASPWCRFRTFGWKATRKPATWTAIHCPTTTVVVRPSPHNLFPLPVSSTPSSTRKPRLAVELVTTLGTLQSNHVWRLNQIAGRWRLRWGRRVPLTTFRSSESARQKASSELIKRMKNYSPNVSKLSNRSTNNQTISMISKSVIIHSFVHSFI